MEAQRSRQGDSPSTPKPEPSCTNLGIVGWTSVLGIPIPIVGCSAYASIDTDKIKKDELNIKERTKILTDLKTGSGSLVA